MTYDPDYDLVTDVLESDYDVNYDDFDGVDYASISADAEEVPLDEIFRSFSFHRVNSGDPYEYGGNACE